MKRVVFIRHAKSSWDNPALADNERPVAKRGKEDILLIGNFLKERKLIPDFVLSSPALRALQTAHGICEIIGFKNEIVKSENLYFHGAMVVFTEIRFIKDRFETAFVFFHNPDINEIALNYLGHHVPNIPTLGGLVTVCQVKHWTDWNIESSSITHFFKPKDLRGSVS